MTPATEKLYDIFKNNTFTSVKELEIHKIKEKGKIISISKGQIYLLGNGHFYVSNSN